MILVTGGTGFVGHNVVRELARSGHRVRLLVRDSSNIASFVRETGCEVVEGNVLDPESLAAACRGVNVVVHLVGIIAEHGRQTYQRVHVEATHNVLQAARQNGIKRILHMSAAGTRPGAPSRYHQTKWEAEQLVRSSGLEWTIFRPSIIYGHGDHFTGLLALLMKFPLNLLTLGFVACPGDGQTALQPVSVTAVAGAFRSALANPRAVGQTYELAGESVTLREMMLVVAEALGLRPKAVSTAFPGDLFVAPLYRLIGYQPVIVQWPLALLKVAVGLFEVVSPFAPINTDQLLMLEETQQADSTPAREDLGFEPGNFSEDVRQYL